MIVNRYNKLQRAMLSILIAVSFMAPLLLASCTPDKISVALVRIYANESMGTGFIMDKTGYAVTSYHVVAGSKTISVVMKSGEQYTGKLICRDEARDFAVIRLNGVSGELPALSAGDSDVVKQGEQVTIAGYQGDKSSPDLATGAVTALKKIDGISFLQLAPAATIGKYGYPVINRAGEVVGMVAWDNSDATIAGLAVSVNEVKDLDAAAVCTDCGDIAISDLSPKSVADTNAIITWQTNKPATGIVEYGPSGSYSSKTQIKAVPGRSHAVFMTGLKPKTAYQYRVISVDSCGNEAVSDGQNLTTAAAGPQSTALTIINVTVSEIASSGATVTWVTNKPSNTVISYGAAENAKTNTRSDSNYVYEHSIRFEGLTPEVRYYLDVQSVSEKGEVAQATAKSFKTASTAPLCCKLACKMPDYVFKDMNGKDFTQDDLAGKKVVMTFVKTTCSICMGQAVYLNDIYQTWPKGDIEFFCVANREKTDDIIEWMKKYGLTVPVYLDVDGELVNYCHLRTIPCTFCINEKGVIIYAREGPFGSKKEFEETLKSIKWK
jgi:peroxiredoxin